MSLAFDVLGDTKKPPVIILHGFFASMRNWRGIAEKLANEFCVYLLDLRNHGASFHHTEMNYEVMAEDVWQFIQQQQLEKVSVLGHSMGGKVAMWLALHHAEAVDKLIIADIAPVSYSHDFANTIHALQTLPLHDLKSRKQAEEYLATDIPELSYRLFLLQNLLSVQGQYQWRVDLNIFAKNAPNIVAFPDTQGLAPYTGQTLFLAGELSHFIQRGQFETLFPHAVLHTIAQAGHWLHVQQPESFLIEVKHFLAS